LVTALRATIPDDAIIRLDANQGYRGYGAKAAIRALRDLRAAGVNYFEQPTEGLQRMAEIRAAIDVPVIADESCWQPHDVVEIAESRAADAISIYVAKAGGLSRARRVAILAETYGLPCDVNGSLESAVGNAASIHLAVAMPAISLPAVTPVSTARDSVPTTVGRYYTDDLINQSFVYQDGLLYPPAGPGLGVEVDEDKLAQFSEAALK
jgi:muconate cycloisomerase